MFTTTYNKEKNLWHGADTPPLYNPQISLAQALLNSMSIFGSKVAQISDNSGIRMTFDEIKTKTIRAAQNLQALGFEPKQVFSLVARNSHDVAPITFASIAIGCPINALDPSFGRTELIHMLKITKPVLIFCDLECYGVLHKCLEELKSEARIFTFGGSVGRSEPVESLFEGTHRENQFIPVQVDGPNETAMILCSSGTTGLSKGVCLSHAAVLDSMSRFVFDSSDVMLCFSSLYWVSGVITLLRGTLIGATRIITTEIFSPELQLRFIKQYKVTWTLNAPHQIVLMMKCARFNETDFSSLKYLLVAGSKAPDYLKTQMAPRLSNGNVHSLYGMTELSGPLSIDYPASKGKNTVGQLFGGFCVKIIDENGNRCGLNVDGEICIKTFYKIQGYYNNQQATVNAIDDECFFVTGDIGHFDEDGDLFVTGRKKEQLKYYNFPIAPSEIDEYLVESPDIESACVVGIPDPMGDLPAAVIVRTEGATISKKDVSDMVAGHFADHYKLRGGVYFVDALPTTPSGKVLRRKVQETAIELCNACKA